MIKYLCWLLIVCLGVTNVCLADWVPYTEANSPLDTDDISGLRMSPDGKVLVGSHGSGLYVKDGDDWSHYDEISTSVPINFSNSIKYSGDSLFIGSASGDLDNQPLGEGLSVLNPGNLSVSMRLVWSITPRRTIST